MKFARDEVREYMQSCGTLRRQSSAVLIAAVSYFIVSSLINPAVYDSVGLSRKRAVAAAANNEHRKSMMRTACAGLMQFLSEAGLLTRPAIAIYQQVDMI